MKKLLSIIGTDSLPTDTFRSNAMDRSCIHLLQQAFEQPLPHLKKQPHPL